MQICGASVVSFAAGCLATFAWYSNVPTVSQNLPSSRPELTPPQTSRSASIVAAIPNNPPMDAPAARPPAPSGEQKRVDHKLDALLEKILARPENTPRDPFSQAVDILKNDGRARTDLLMRYSKETDAFARSQLRILLSFVPNDDVRAFAIRMGTDGNPTLRAEGFEMLRNIQMSSAEARELLIGAISTEQDTAALRAAIASLMPGASPSPQESARIVEQLNRIVQHSSPEVRGESLLALTRWDRSGAAEGLVFNGLTDPQAPVQEAAMTSLFENPIRSDRVKSALVKVAADTGNLPQTRMMAVEALGGFNLTQQENTTLAKLRESIPPLR
jgi:hypothetical protein